MSRGLVSIIGAGPGDPELITVKALKRIQSADVIMYDRLVTDELLAEARDGALRIYCGKAPGFTHEPGDDWTYAGFSCSGGQTCCQA